MTDAERISMFFAGLAAGGFLSFLTWKIANQRKASVVQDENCPPADYKTVCGVIGGVGPEATVDMFSKVVQRRRNLLHVVQNNLGNENILDEIATVSYAAYNEDDAVFLCDVRKRATGSFDQQHIPMVIYNNPQIPDRTRYILDVYINKVEPTCKNPYDYMLKTTRSLIAAGASAICVPCNTAHFFFPMVKETIERERDDIKFLNMIELTAEFALSMFQPEGELTLGLLATDGTCSTGVYPKTASKVSSKIKIIKPDDIPDGNQPNVMEAIYGEKGIKAGFDKPEETAEAKRNQTLLKTEALKLIKAGASAVIMGCTEIPLVLNETEHDDVVLLNPTNILADAVVRTTLLSRVFHD